MSNPNKTLVAITGNIGSGKSTFANFILKVGHPVIFADDISKNILSSDPKVRLEIIKVFGASSFTGININKDFLAQQIFSDPKKLKKINSILHPKVRKKIKEISEEHFKSKNIVFVEAALIYESKIENLFDYVVLITADQDIRMKRSSTVHKFSETDFLNRDKNQIKQEVKQNKADFIFSNNGSKSDLKQKAELLVRILESTHE